MSSNCSNHTDKPAKYECTNCGKLICEMCVKSFHAGGFFTYFCPACNSQCEEIASAPQKQVSAPPPQNDQNNVIEDIAEEEGDKTEVLSEEHETEPKSRITHDAFYERPEEPKKEVDEVPSESKGLENQPTSQIDLSGMDITAKKEDKKPIEEDTSSKQEKVKTGSILVFFIMLIFAPGKAFKKCYNDLCNSFFYKFRFICICLILFGCASYFEIKNLSFFTGLIRTVISLFVFSIIFSTGIKISGKVKSYFSLLLQVISVWLFFGLIQNLSCIPFQNEGTQFILMFFLSFFLFMKIYVYGMGIVKNFECNFINVLFIYLFSSSLIAPVYYFLNLNG